MDWSAALSLTTSRAKQHRPNYGSFASSSALTSSSSLSRISIPESIPEHQCVLQFKSPRLRSHGPLCEVEDPIEPLGSYGGIGGGSNTATVTVTTKAINRASIFKMLLSNPTVSHSNGTAKDDQHRIAGSAARAAGGDDAPPTESSSLLSSTSTSNYWIQERERLRLKRDRWHRFRGDDGSPTKSAAKDATGDGEPSSWRAVAIMCSVPIALVIIFVIVVLIFGDGSEGIAARLQNAAAIVVPRSFASSATVASATAAPATPLLRQHDGA